MVRYEKDEDIKPGTKVRIAEVGTYYGKVAEVIHPALERVWSTSRKNTRQIWVAIPGRLTPCAFYADDLEKVEDTKFKSGDRVRGTGIVSGTRYEGTVVPVRSSIYGLPEGAETHIKVTKVISGSGQSVGNGAYINNVERIEEMAYVKNLVGPKPEPVQEPKHPTPWASSGRDVRDANGNAVLRVTTRNTRDLVPMDQAYELARVIAEAVSEKFASKAEDSPSPF